MEESQKKPSMIEYLKVVMNEDGTWDVTHEAKEDTRENRNEINKKVHDIKYEDGKFTSYCLDDLAWKKFKMMEQVKEQYDEAIQALHKMVEDTNKKMELMGTLATDEYDPNSDMPLWIYNVTFYPHKFDKGNVDKAFVTTRSAFYMKNGIVYDKGDKFTIDLVADGGRKATCLKKNMESCKRALMKDALEGIKKDATKYSNLVADIEECLAERLKEPSEKMEDNHD